VSYQRKVGDYFSAAKSQKQFTGQVKHNRSEMVAVLGPYEALPYYIHTYILDKFFPEIRVYISVVFVGKARIVS
jgi:hypothetical protein